MYKDGPSPTGIGLGTVIGITAPGSINSLLTSPLLIRKRATKKIGEILDSQRTLVTLLGDAIQTGSGIDGPEDNLEKVKDYRDSLIKLSSMDGYGNLTEDQRRLSINLENSLNTYERILTGK